MAMLFSTVIVMSWVDHMAVAEADLG